MLVLSFDPGTTADAGSYVDVDGPCRIVVTRVRGSRVRLGFECSDEVTIVRGAAIKKEPAAARAEGKRTDAGS